MMKKIRNLATTIMSVAMALTIAEANISYADETTTSATKDMTTTEVTTEASTEQMEAEIVSEEPRAGDLIWITDETVMYQTPDKMFDANISAKIKYEIYLIGHYDDDHWRVLVPMLNEPERVLLIPIDEYNIEVISHDNYVVGDLTGDQRIDAFDMVLLRRALFRDYNLYDYSDIDALIERSIDRQLADVNSDSEISVADLVCMTNFILGRAETFR